MKKLNMRLRNKTFVRLNGRDALALPPLCIKDVQHVHFTDNNLFICFNYLIKTQNTRNLAIKYMVIIFAHKLHISSGNQLCARAML